jgi:hypothetical protein
VDLTPILFWLHVGSAFAFVLAHGVSVFVAVQLPRERDPARIGALLDLSLGSVKLTSLFLLVVLASGVLAAFAGDYWGRGWVWAAIGILVVLFLWMGFRGVGWFDEIRHAVGKEGFHQKEAKAGAATADLETLLRSSRGVEMMVVGLIGLGLLVWLMIEKPF